MLLRGDVREWNRRSQNTFKTGKCINKLVQGVVQVGCTSQISWMISGVVNYTY